MSQFIDTVKGTMNTAVETLSTVAQNFVEKNRTKAKLNRLRMVMKNESELMNRAYIALGKEFYESLKKGDVPSSEKQQKLVGVVDGSKAKIARARDCYREVLEASQDDFLYAAPKDEDDYSKDDVIDITVACSNEDDYSSSPFDSAAEAAKEKASDVKENAEEAADAAKDKLSAAKENVEGAVEKAKENVEGAVEKAKENVEKAKANVESAVEKAKENAGEAFEATKEKLSVAKDKLRNTVDGALDGLGDDEADDGELF